MRARACVRLLAAALLACLGASASAQRPHVHGVATLAVSVEGDALRLQLEAPLEVLVGFEHAPRTAAEGQALQRARELLARPELLRPNAEAGCAPEVAEPPEATLRRAEGHADLAREFGFRCARPAQLKVIDVGLFEAFARLQRIDAVLVTASGQGKRTLQRPHRNLSLSSR